MKWMSGKPGVDRIFGLPIAYEVSAGMVLFRRVPDGNREYLLLQYRHRHWEFARGHVEHGESLIEAARRETEEETGIVSLSLLPKFHRRIHFFYRAKGRERAERKKEGRSVWIVKTVHFFLAEVPNDLSVRLSDESLDALWLSPERAIRRATFENAKKLLRAAERFLEKVEY